MKRWPSRTARRANQRAMRRLHKRKTRWAKRSWIAYSNAPLKAARRAILVRDICIAINQAVCSSPPRNNLDAEHSTLRIRPLPVDSPKKFYPCNFLGCYRAFVRQDLFARHQERRKRRNARLQDGNYFAQTSSGDTSPVLPQPASIPSSNTNPRWRRSSTAGSLVPQARNQANQHSAGLLPSSPLTGVNRVFGFQHASSLPNQTCNLPDGQDVSHIPVQGQRLASTAVASCGSGHGDELQSSMPEAIQVFASQSQDLRAVFPIPTELRGSPTAHQGFPISVNGYSDIPRARNLVRIGINSSRHGTQCTVFHVEFNHTRLDSCKPRI